MINLIPNEEKKKKVKDFYFRFTTVFLTVLSLAILIASVAILPSFFLSSVKKNFYTGKLKAEKNEAIPAPDQDILVLVNDLKNKLDLIENSEKNTYLISERVINEIMLRKMSDIKITKISYLDTPEKGKNVSVSGTASSRERLLLFRNALLDGTVFKEVDLPISNFIKGSNIQFSLSLIPS